MNTVILAGTDFDMGVDYAYWLFVDVGIPDGVFVPCEEVGGNNGNLEVPDLLDIDAAGPGVQP